MPEFETYKEFKTKAKPVKTMSELDDEYHTGKFRVGKTKED